MDFKFEPKRSYVKAFQRYLKRRNYREHYDDQKLPYFCTSDFSGLYCIEFQSLKGVEFFNKTTTSRYLADCQFYPPTAIAKNADAFEKLRLENKYYYIKPKYGAHAKNISVSYGKKIIINQDSFSGNNPVIVQEEIPSKLQYGCKVDYRTYVLYVKVDNKISVYYYPYHIKRVCTSQVENREDMASFFSPVDTSNDIVRIDNEEIERSLRNAQSFILSNMPKQNYSKVEFFLVAFDLIEDKYGKFWIMEVNWDPAFLYNKQIHSLHQDIINDIIDATDTYHKTSQIGFNKFKELL